ncbi:MAG: RNA polymerase factor sigma-54 [Burkholderiaceae bacterium]
MELRPHIGAQAKQFATITHRAIQSINLLKFGHEELCDFLREQEERNPLIEVLIPEIGGEEAAARPAQPASAASPQACESGSGMAAVARSQASWGQPGTVGAELPGVDQTCFASVSLREHLLAQVGLCGLDRVDRMIATELVESIEPDGYLRRDLGDVADVLGVDPARVEAVLQTVHRFEPAGIGARNVGECLRLQLAEKNLLSSAMALLLENIELLSRYELPALARACGVDKATIASMIREIRKLDPRPGRQFDAEPVVMAIPDVTLEIRDDGSLHVELNASFLPRVLVNRDYYAEMRALSTDEIEVRFVTDCMKDANMLARNLDQRSKTLLRVATEIVKRQKAFFTHGAGHMRPLCQGDVAQTLGMHRSTVCRAISGKYIMTNRGLFELKHFFSNAITSTEGDDDYSAQTIRMRIRDLIAAESDGEVQSDDAIMVSLKDSGIDIARRTVAKYREMLGIPSSAMRKRQARAARLEAQALAA